MPGKPPKRTLEERAMAVASETGIRRIEYSVGKVKEICEMLERGNYLTSSCAAVGVPYATFQGWMISDPWVKQSVEMAYEKGETLLLEEIRHAASLNGGRNWTAAAWILERTRPEKYGRRDRLTIENVKTEAGKLAEKLGLDVGEVLKEAERLVQRGGQAQ